MAGHTWWRINIRSHNSTASNPYCDIVALEFAESVGGPNLSYVGNNNGSSFSSGGQPPNNAFDNNDGTNWNWFGAGRGYIGWQFNTAVDVQEVRVKASGSYSPFWFDVEWSDDGNSWYYFWTEYGQTGWNGMRSFPRPTLSQISNPHRYWCVFYQQSMGGTYSSLTDIEFRNTFSGPDLVPNPNGAFGSGADGGPGGNPPYYDKNAFDDSLTTRWASDDRPWRSYIGYDFGSPVSVQEVALTVMGVTGGYVDENPRDFAIVYSDDGLRWWQWGYYQDQTFDVSQRTFTSNTRSFVNPNARRYWRIRLLESNGDVMAAKKIQMRGIIGGPDLCTGGTPIADSYYDDSSSYSPVNAFDNNDSSVWASKTNANTAYIGYDFGLGNEQEILEIAYAARDSYGTQSPKIAILEWSGNGTDWFESYKIRFGAFASGETKIRSKILPLANSGRNPHKFWRIRHVAYTDNICSGVKVQMRQGFSLADLTATQLYRSWDPNHYSDWVADRLFDDNDNTIYAGYEYVAVEFFNPVTVDEFTWKNRSEAYQNPVNGFVEWSDDGVTWTVAWDWKFGSFGGGNVTKTVTNRSVSGLRLPPRRRQSFSVS